MHKKKDPCAQQLFQAKSELHSVRSSLEQAYSVFNHTADPELIEITVLEISALQSKYSRILKNLKNFREV